MPTDIQHDDAMGRDPSKQPTPDLFSTDTVGDDALPPTKPGAVDTTTETATKRYVLPKDLPAALKRLSDSEFALMHASMLDEMKRRGKLAHGVETDLQTLRNRFDVRRNLPKVSLPPTKTRRHVDIAEVPLTRGQVNAVRAPSRRASRRHGLRGSSGFPNRMCGRRWPRMKRANNLNLYLSVN